MQVMSITCRALSAVSNSWAALAVSSRQEANPDAEASTLPTSAGAFPSAIAVTVAYKQGAAFSRVLGGAWAGGWPWNTWPGATSTSCFAGGCLIPGVPGALSHGR